MYYAFIQPYFDYALTVWGNTTNLNRVQKLQNRIARIMSRNFNYNIPGISVVRDLGWQDIMTRKRYLTSVLTYKCLNGLAPNYLCDAFTYCGDVHNYCTRGSNRRNLYVPQPNLEYFKRSFIYVGPNVWNDIPDSIRNVNSIQSFKQRMKEYLK